MMLACTRADGPLLGLLDQVDVRRPLAFFLRARALRSRDLRSFALRDALRRAVHRRWLRVFIAVSLWAESFSGAHSVFSWLRDQV